ncbi:hypothetical protein D9599_06980 [Roseomonas sp. KE2513]|uniref:hypothetical protein n=1 Tax=Roseomonas sp. KE2513 TaxID=2479202 RepID=UPI0018DFF14F|nr:hypothetical protein [Roseomonas sp. KE2513]MBI0535310.1 hypothetical protein [Roseomonas sp. KE2513]
MPHTIQVNDLSLHHAVALPLASGRATTLAAGDMPATQGRGAAVLHVLGAAVLRLLETALLRVFGTAFLFTLAGCLCIAGAAAAYSLKRALNLDIVPGVDMLPDAEIEDAIRAVLALMGF